MVEEELKILQALKHPNIIYLHEIINDPNKTFMRTTKTQWRYRSTPKTKFDPKSYKTKKIMEGVNLIFGILKK